MKSSLVRLRHRFVLLGLLLVLAASGCSTLGQADKAERKAEKLANKEMRQARKEYKKGLKRHRRNQDKRTKVQMTEGKKQSDKWNNSRKRSPRNKVCNHD